jgi:hypothetical protein
MTIPLKLLVLVMCEMLSATIISAQIANEKYLSVDVGSGLSLSTYLNGYAGKSGTAGERMYQIGLTYGFLNKKGYGLETGFSFNEHYLTVDFPDTIPGRKRETATSRIRAIKFPVHMMYRVVNRPSYQLKCFTGLDFIRYRSNDDVVSAVKFYDNYAVLYEYGRRGAPSWFLALPFGLQLDYLSTKRVQLSLRAGCSVGLAGGAYFVSYYGYEEQAPPKKSFITVGFKTFKYDYVSLDVCCKIRLNALAKPKKPKLQRQSQ